jgi:hypothetical protein
MALVPLVGGQPDGEREPIPRLFLDRKLFLARLRERIELGLPPCFRLSPFRSEPAFLLEAVQSGIQRTLVDPDGLARDESSSGLLST